MTRIASVTTRLFNVPLDEILVDAKHGDHSHFHLITATISLEDGRSGTGYSYTGGRGGQAIAAMIRHDLAPFLIGRDAGDIEALNAAMQWHMHYVGRGGILSFAISAVDIALWDLRCKSIGQPLWKAAGGAAKSCKAYGGGIDLAFPMPKAAEQHPILSGCGAKRGQNQDRAADTGTGYRTHSRGPDPDRSRDNIHDRCQLFHDSSAGH